MADAATKMTQAYADYDQKVGLINNMIMETTAIWRRFLKTSDDWMGNFVQEDLPQVDFVRADQVKLAAYLNRININQQHRSQALTENKKRELVESTYIDQRRVAIQTMISNINFATTSSRQFLEMIGEKLYKLEVAEKR